MSTTALLPAEPQFTETVVADSRTRQLYGWLSEQDYLWMLDEPHDRRLAELAGMAPVTRMWIWKLSGNVSAEVHDASTIEDAFSAVELLIEQRFRAAGEKP